MTPKRIVMQIKHASFYRKTKSGFTKTQKKQTIDEEIGRRQKKDYLPTYLLIYPFYNIYLAMVISKAEFSFL